MKINTIKLNKDKNGKDKAKERVGSDNIHDFICSKLLVFSGRSDGSFWF